jgi:hypothetical protein
VFGNGRAVGSILGRRLCLSGLLLSDQTFPHFKNLIPVTSFAWASQCLLRGEGNHAGDDNLHFSARLRTGIERRLADYGSSFLYRD